MKIEEAFKLFHDVVLKDPINIDPKNRQLTIATHKQTQLVDIQEIFELPENYPYIYISKTDSMIDTTFSTDIHLPFLANFIQVTDKICLYIREYSPGVYTGRVVLYTESETCVKEGMLFSIVLKKQKYLRIPLTGVKFTSDHEVAFIESVANFFIRIIIGTITTLEKTSKTADIYKTDKVRYITFKNKKTKDKETVKKPVYVYMSKNKSISQHKQYSKEPMTRENSWLVRGHWRKLFNEEWHGKDSEGKPIKGYTWVKPFKKGNLDMDVEQRTYIYKQ